MESRTWECANNIANPMTRVMGFFGVMLMLVSGTLVYARQDEPEQWIAFISDRDGNAEIYQMRPDGSGVQQLTHTPNDVVHCWIKWSQDGRWLNFAFGQRGNQRYECGRDDGLPIYGRMQKDTTKMQFIFSDSYFSDSPNGSWLLIPKWDDSRTQGAIYRVKPNGKPLQFLSEGRDAVWSSNGKWIAFAGNLGSDDNLYVMHTQNLEITRLRLEDFYIEYLIPFLWAEDGENILFYAFSKSSEMPSGLYSIEVINQELRLISDTIDPLDYMGSQATLSSDGLWLAFISPKLKLSVVNLKSGESRELSDYTLPEDSSRIAPGAISWSPDSRWIVFSKYDEQGRSKIWRIHPDGTGLEQLTFGPGEDLRPAWSPLIDKAWDGWGLMGIGGIMWGIGYGKRIIGR